jgi:hypothetical protein
MRVEVRVPDPCDWRFGRYPAVLVCTLDEAHRVRSYIPAFQLWATDMFGEIGGTWDLRVGAPLRLYFMREIDARIVEKTWGDGHAVPI